MKTQIIFWVSVFIILLVSFGRLSGNYINSFYFVSFFVPVVIATSVVFNEVLVEKYLLPKKYFHFALYTFYLLIISLSIEISLGFVSFMLIGYYEVENVNILISDFRILPLLLYLIVFIYAFIGLLSRLNNIQGVVGDPTEDANFITVRSERKNRRIICKSILYIESMSDYIRIFTSSNERIVSRETISRLESRLPLGFLRIHRSYIVNTDHLTSYNKEELIIGDKSLPVSRTYKTETINTLKNL